MKICTPDALSILFYYSSVDKRIRLAGYSWEIPQKNAWICFSALQSILFFIRKQICKIWTPPRAQLQLVNHLFIDTKISQNLLCLQKHFLRDCLRGKKIFSSSCLTWDSLKFKFSKIVASTLRQQRMWSMGIYLVHCGTSLNIFYCVLRLCSDS